MDIVRTTKDTLRHPVASFREAKLRTVAICTGSFVTAACAIAEVTEVVDMATGGESFEEFAGDTAVYAKAGVGAALVVLKYARRSQDRSQPAPGEA